MSRSTLSRASESSNSQCLNGPTAATSLRNDIAGVLKQNTLTMTNLPKEQNTMNEHHYSVTVSLCITL